MLPKLQARPAALPCLSCTSNLCTAVVLVCCLWSSRAVYVSLGRQALLSGALEDAFSEVPGKSKEGHRKDALRPGKLLTLMSGMQRELSEQDSGQHAQTLRQLESIRLKLMQLLEAIGYP